MPLFFNQWLSGPCHFFFSLIMAWNGFWQYFSFCIFGLKTAGDKKKSDFLLCGQGGLLSLHLSGPTTKKTLFLCVSSPRSLSFLCRFYYILSKTKPQSFWFWSNFSNNIIFSFVFRTKKQTQWLYSCLLLILSIQKNHWTTNLLLKKRRLKQA